MQKKEKRSGPELEKKKVKLQAENNKSKGDLLSVNLEGLMKKRTFHAYPCICINPLDFRALLVFSQNQLLRPTVWVHKGHHHHQQQQFVLFTCHLFFFLHIHHLYYDIYVPIFLIQEHLFIFLWVANFDWWVFFTYRVTQRPIT